MTKDNCLRAYLPRITGGVFLSFLIMLFAFCANFGINVVKFKATLNSVTPNVNGTDSRYAKHCARHMEENTETCFPPSRGPRSSWRRKC